MLAAVSAEDAKTKNWTYKELKTTRALLLTNARHGFHNRTRYWRGDGDASNCFSKQIAGIALSA